MGDLLASLSGDAFLRGAVQDMNKLMERALLWLHEQEVVTLGKGLTVFRPAMTVHLRPGGGGFTQKDFTPLNGALSFDEAIDPIYNGQPDGLG